MRHNWQSGENRPEDHNVELEVTYDAHQEPFARFGGRHRRRRHRAGGRSSDQEGGAGRICSSLQRRRHHRLDPAGLRHLREAVSGYITAQFEGGNLNTQYNYGSISDAATAAAITPIPRVPAIAAALASISGLDSRTTQRVLIAGQRRSKQHDLQSQSSSAGRSAPTSGSTSPRTPPTAP